MVGECIARGFPAVLGRPSILGAVAGAERSGGVYGPSGAREYPAGEKSSVSGAGTLVRWMPLLLPLIPPGEDPPAGESSGAAAGAGIGSGCCATRGLVGRRA